MAKRTLPLFISLTALVVGLLFAGPGVSANDGDDDTPNIPERRELVYPNLGSHLDEVVASYESGRQSQREAADQGVVSQNDSILVTIYLSGNVSAVEDFLDDNGASVRNVGEDYIEAYVPVSLLGQVSEQDGVTRVREIIPPQPMYGNITSQGVDGHLATAWHNNGYQGAGVKIGIIDSGFYGWRSLQGVELPSSVGGVRCYSDRNGNYGGLEVCDVEDWGVHGTAVGETIIDIAPESTLYLADPATWGDLQNVVQWMVSEGVQVINMSLGFEFDGPGDGSYFYSDSPLNAVDDAVSGGITFVNSAGNDSRKTWYGPYSDSNNNNLHEWEGTDQGLGFAFRADRLVVLQLRWDDTWGGASKDLDLYVADANGNILYSRADAQQGGANDVPIEILSFDPPADGIAYIFVRQESGSAPAWIQLTAWRTSDLEHYTEGGSITSPAESANSGLLAVGASPWYDTSKIEYYSSRGPTPDGRTKPDITGVTCGSTVSYPDDTRTWDNNQQCGFSGTSQASPHVAGLAALVKQANPSFTPAQTANYLKTNAVDRGAAGADNVWGSGFAQLPSPPQCVESLTADGTTNGTWTSGCQSQVASPDPADASGAKGYAKYYTFTTTEQKAVTITLDSDDTPTPVDTYLYLRPGTAKSGAATAANDDYGTPLNNAAACADTSGLEQTDSCITVSALPAGSYTIEATTYKAATTGTFTLKISGLGSSSGGPTPPPADTCTDAITADGSTSGTWAAGCQSAETDRGYARYYSFTLSESKAVTINLKSTRDTYLYLRSGGKTGAVAAKNDDHGDLLSDTAAPIPVACANTTGLGQRDSCITITSLPAGSYTIEATTYRANEAGSFTLTVSGLSTGGGGPTPPPTDTCTDALAADGSTSGTWAAGCQSAETDRGYARYYSFTLSESKAVTITLKSSRDTYLYLRSGDKTGAVAAKNDDHGTLDNTAACANATGLGERDSCITVSSLSAGSYTIEATTYRANEAGSFTLTVSGLGTAPSAACVVGDTLSPGQSCTGQDFTATVRSNGNLSLEFTGTAAPPTGLSFTRSGNNWTVAGLP